MRWSRGLIDAQKSFFYTNHPNWGIVEHNFKNRLAKIRKIFGDFIVLNKYLWYYMKFYNLEWYYIENVCNSVVLRFLKTAAVF